MVLVAVLAMASWVYGQGYGNSSPQGQQPQSGAGGQSAQRDRMARRRGAGQGGLRAQAGGTAAAPQGSVRHRRKRRRINAYKAAAAATDPEATKKQRPISLTNFRSTNCALMLFRKAMQDYRPQQRGKALEMANKVIAIDPDDPQSLILKAEVLSEKPAYRH